MACGGLCEEGIECLNKTVMNFMIQWGYDINTRIVSKFDIATNHSVFALPATLDPSVTELFKLYALCRS